MTFLKSFDTRPGEKLREYTFPEIMGSCAYYDQVFSRVVQQTEAGGIKYAFWTMNSNSFAYTALYRAGLRIPNKALPLAFWEFLPGWGNHLPIRVWV